MPGSQKVKADISFSPLRTKPERDAPHLLSHSNLSKPNRYLTFEFSILYCN